MRKSPVVVNRGARSLCVELARVVADAPMEYQMARLIARLGAIDYETADAAIAFAIQQGWLTGEGEPPHSICLTDSGRNLAK